MLAGKTDRVIDFNDGGGCVGQFRIINNIFNFHLFDERTNYNCVELNIEYDENKTEIDNFLHKLLKLNLQYV